MKAIFLPEYQGNIIRALRSLELKELDDVRLIEDEVLIAVESSPCNPSDLAFIQGGYNVRKILPAVPGFEGSGRVIEAGPSDEANALVGKRVSFFSQSDRGGSWASHIPVKVSDCIIISEELDPDQAACFSVNPFTAYAMVELAKRIKSQAIIQNAAAGQVGKFINTLAKNEGMEVINIVRKEEQIETMKARGYVNVLCSRDEKFSDELNKLAHELNAILAFDAVGGEQSGNIIQAMPEGGTLLLYGALGARTLSEIPATDVIFSRKKITGFNMNEWKAGKSPEAFNQISIELQDSFIKNILTTDIQGKFPLDKHGEALMNYIRNMSAGKILLEP